VRRFATFWWDFIVGDDWRLALGVLIGIAATVLLHVAGLDPWWLLPPLIAFLLMRSLQRASRESA
jgi:hypothetical protein